MTYVQKNESDMDENDICKLKIFSKRNKRAPVFVTNFSQGEVSSKLNNQLKFACFKKDADNHKINCYAQRTLVANNGRLTYTGLSTNSQTHQFFVGVRSKTTGKMRLYDSVVFRMKTNDMNSSKANVNVHSEVTTPKSYWEEINDLTKDFGIKSRKRALSTREKCSVDTSVEERINIYDPSLSLSPKKPVGDYHQQNIDYFPPQNRVASSINDVFDINDIISLEEDSALDAEVHEFLNSSQDVKTRKRFSFCRYVNEHLDDADFVKTKYLFYYNYLVTMHRLKYSDIRKKDPAPEVPEPFKGKFLQNFTITSATDRGRKVRTFPTQMRDKFLSYIFVLALFIDDFVVNINQVLNDLNATSAKLTTMAQALGCHVGTRKIGDLPVKVAELKLPLFVLIPKYAKKSAFSKNS